LYAILPSFGTPLQNDTLFLKNNNVISTTGSPNTVTLSSLTPKFSKGYVRVKIYNDEVAAGTITGIQVVLYDGTQYVLIGAFATSTLLSIIPGGTQLVTNGSITSGAAVLTTATANTFTPSMVGLPIAVSGAGAGGITLYTTVLSWQSGTQVTLAANASTTVTTSATVTMTGQYGNVGVLGTSVAGIDLLFPFEVDMSCTQCSVITTMTGATSTAVQDVEVSATS
jgi:hypothetical protein